MTADTISETHIGARIASVPLLSVDLAPVSNRTGVLVGYCIAYNQGNHSDGDCV